MKVWLIKFLMFAGLLMLAGCSIDGTVKDDNGVVLADAQVRAVYKGKTKSTTTDVDGKYSIGDLGSDGEATVTVTKDGFIEQTQTTELSSSGVSLNFVLIADSIAPSTGIITGVIKDSRGDPIEGVNVFSTISEVLTNKLGEYTLEANLGEHISVTTDFLNYAQNSHAVTVVENETVNLDITILPVDMIEIFDVDNGAIINTKGATIEFGASSITNLDGSAYTGNVTAKISFNQVTSLVGQKVFPGEYVGVKTNGEEANLISYGFIDVTLEDTQGNKLRLADGATATLTYPMDKNITSTPTSIALWYYDIIKGIWIENGLATYDAGTNSYSGMVSHFTTWALNVPTGSASMTGCVEDINAVPVSPVNILVQTPGYYGYEENQDANGNFTITNIPANQDVSLRATTQALSSDEIILTFNDKENRVLSPCLVLEKAPLKKHSITGRLVGSDGKAIANQYLNIQVDGVTVVGVEIDYNGNFTSKAFISDPKSVVTLMDNLTIGEESTFFEKVIIIDQNSDVTNLGNLEVKTTTIIGCIQYPDGSRLFDYALIRKDSASGAEYANVESDGGAFSFILPQNSNYYNFYAVNMGGGQTANFNFTANTSVIYFNNPCLTVY